MSREFPSTAEQIPILISVIFNDKYEAVKKFLKRKLEAFAVLCYSFEGLVWPVLSIFVGFLIIFSPFCIIAALYGYWFYRDFKTPERGSRERPEMRDWYWWRLMADYFPIKIVKTADLPPENNYIIGCHPHGIGCYGAFISLCTNANGFSNYYPGIHSTAATMKGMFYFPIRRERLIALGLIAVSNESLSYYLSNGKGKAVGIVVGGAEELLDAHPGLHDLTLKSRKGFVRIAIRHGAHLVPMYSFGENELFSQIPNRPGTIIRNIQESIKKYLSWAPTLIFGDLWCGILPKRKPINCVFGRPIPVTKNDNPSEDEVNEIHRQYCNELQFLFDKHKTQFGLSDDERLRFI